MKITKKQGRYSKNKKGIKRKGETFSQWGPGHRVNSAWVRERKGVNKRNPGRTEEDKKTRRTTMLRLYSIVQCGCRERESLLQGVGGRGHRKLSGRLAGEKFGEEPCFLQKEGPAAGPEGTAGEG